MGAKPTIMMIMKDLLAIGGAKLSAIQLAFRLKQLGYEVMFMGYGTRDSIRNHLAKLNSDLTAPIFPITPPGRLLRTISNHWPNIAFLSPCLFALWRNRARYDIVHGPLLMESGMICAIATRLFHKPSVVKLGSAGRYGDVRRVYGNKIGRLRRYLFSHVSLFVCLTEEIENELSYELNIPGNKLVRIANGVDLKTFYPVSPDQKTEIRKKLGLTECKKIVLFVGRLELKKRVDFLLDAWRYVHHKNDGSARLFIVGDGRLRARLETYRDELRLNDSVVFYGESKNIAPIMQSSDLFVLPSVSEGLANVFLEAMATGLPIIATKNIGNAEVLSPEVNGLFFEEENQKELAEKILYLLNHEEVAHNFSTSARKTVEERFNIETIVQQYARLYHELGRSNFLR